MLFVIIFIPLLLLPCRMPNWFEFFQLTRTRNETDCKSSERVVAMEGNCENWSNKERSATVMRSQGSIENWYWPKKCWNVRVFCTPDSASIIITKIIIIICMRLILNNESKWSTIHHRHSLSKCCKSFSHFHFYSFFRFFFYSVKFFLHYIFLFHIYFFFVRNMVCVVQQNNSFRLHHFDKK